MTARDDSPAADALRDAGYVKLPPLWVPAEIRDEVPPQTALLMRAFVLFGLPDTWPKSKSPPA
jgi:hypothetical protein